MQIETLEQLIKVGAGRQFSVSKPTNEKPETVVCNHLTTQEIIANKESIYFCAKAFREDVNTLIP